MEAGTHAELLAHGGRYAEMWRLQQSGEADAAA
jgi:ATP-binding cassette, subfamily B, heavy metal transporter